MLLSNNDHAEDYAQEQEEYGETQDSYGRVRQQAEAAA